MGNPRLILVVTLEVRKDAAAAFERFETQAAAILSRWEGRIERVIRLDELTSGDTFQEVQKKSGAQPLQAMPPEGINTPVSNG